MAPISSFDARLALFLARCSHAAYGSPPLGPVGRAALLGLQATSFDCGPISGFVGCDDTRCVLAFEGTHDLSGWLDDVNCRLIVHREYPGRVHCGFAQALDSVWPQIQPLVAGAAGARTLYVTGHSLGGALSSLAQWRLVSHGRAVQAAYTFGEPRVGEAAWAASWAQANTLAHWRVVHDCDPIPRVPFWPLFHHVGSMAWFDRFDHLNADPTLWQRVVNWVEEEIERWPGPWTARVVQLAEEHFISAYIAALRQAVADHS